MIEIRDLHGRKTGETPNPIQNGINNNILICGSSGSGKTTLLKYIEKQEQPDLKIIFKEDKERSTRIKNHRPFIQRDRINFLDSWKESQEVDNTGYMILQEYLQLESIRKEGETIGEMNKRINELEKDTKNGIETTILRNIQSKIRTLYPSKTEEKIPIQTTLSMEELTEHEYHFFSSYIIRNKYDELLNQKISIDEVHRLKPIFPLIGRISREIRSRGEILLTTQSLSDVPSDIINNMGSIYLFQTLDQRDIKFLGEISERLKESILQLDEHEFIELRSFRRMEKLGRPFKMELII